MLKWLWIVGLFQAPVYHWTDLSSLSLKVTSTNKQKWQWPSYNLRKENGTLCACKKDVSPTFTGRYPKIIMLVHDRQTCFFMYATIAHCNICRHQSFDKNSSMQYLHLKLFAPKKNIYQNYVPILFDTARKHLIEKWHLTESLETDLI